MTKEQEFFSPRFARGYIVTRRTGLGGPFGPFWPSVWLSGPYNDKTDETDQIGPYADKTDKTDEIPVLVEGNPKETHDHINTNSTNQFYS